MLPSSLGAVGAEPGSPAGIWTPFAVATAEELPLPVQHGLEVAALEPGHQSIVGARLVPGEKRKCHVNRDSDTPTGPFPDPSPHSCQVGLFSTDLDS